MQGAFKPSATCCRALMPSCRDGAAPGAPCGSEEPGGSLRAACVRALLAKPGKRGPNCSARLPLPRPARATGGPGGGEKGGPSACVDFLGDRIRAASLRHRRLLRNIRQCCPRGNLGLCRALASLCPPDGSSLPMTLVVHSSANLIIRGCRDYLWLALGAGAVSFVMIVTRVNELRQWDSDLSGSEAPPTPASVGPELEGTCIIIG